MSTMTSQTTGVSSVYSTDGSGADQRKLQSSASLAFVQAETICEVISLWINLKSTRITIIISSDSDQ